MRDIRTGKGVKVPKDPKLREMLSLGPGELEDKTVTVVYSTDLVNVHFINFCTRKIDVAKVSHSRIISILALKSNFLYLQFWAIEMTAVLRNSHAVCLSPIQSLEKIFALIKLMANTSGKVPVKRYAANGQSGKVKASTLTQAQEFHSSTSFSSLSPFQYCEVVCSIAQGRPASC